MCIVIRDARDADNIGRADDGVVRISDCVLYHFLLIFMAGFEHRLIPPSGQAFGLVEWSTRLVLRLVLFDYI